MFGFARGPLWALLLATGVAHSQTLPADLDLVQIASGRSGALAVRHAGDGSGRLFVVRQGGTIDVILASGTVATTPFLQLAGAGGTAPPLGFSSGGERGLLGLAFHPQYAVNGRFFVSYTDGGGDTAITEYLVSNANPDRADAASGRVILRVYQPASNHNGGDIHFGPDGYLYIGMGDGGGGNDSACGTGQALVPGATSCSVSGGDSFLQVPNANAPRGNADSRALLGKMLRIDIDVEDPRTPPPAGADLCAADGSSGVARYDIPPDNPFAGDAGANAAACDEIYHFGLRNPWRFSFDRVTEDLIIGDVGQGQWEEVDLVPPGGGLNFGWVPCEGFHVTGSPTSLCTLAGRTDPILAYGHGTGFSISGGFRYRGPWPALDGVLFFADFGGALFAEIEGGGGWSNPPSPWRTGQGNIAGFGEDEGGNVHVATLTGTVRRVVLSTPPPPGINVNAFATLQTDAGVLGLADPGDVIRFSATALNTGGESVDTLQVSVAIGIGSPVPLSCSPTALATNQGAVCSGPDYVVTQADFESGLPIVGEFDATALDAGDDPVSDADAASVSIAPPNPALTVSKSVQISPDAGAAGLADVGDGLTYTVSVENTGNVTLDQLEVLDQLDGGATTPLSCAPLQLAPGAQATCSPYGIVVTQEQIEAQEPILNLASAIARAPGDVPVEAEDAASVAVVAAAPALTVQKDASLSVDTGSVGVADVGDVIDYTVSVTNSGNVRLTGLTVSDAFAGGVPQPLSCAPSTLEPQQVANCPVYQHTVSQADVDAGIALVNVASAAATRIGGSAPVQGSDDASVAVATAQAALVLDKQAVLEDLDADQEADVGETITYLFEVENTGNVTLTAVQVQDSRLGGAVACASATLSPGQTTACGPADYTVVEADLNTAAIVNSAVALGTPPSGGAIESAPASTSTPADQGDIIFADGFEG